MTDADIVDAESFRVAKLAIPSEFNRRAVAHYAKALCKHPRFADVLFPSTDVAEARQTLQNSRAIAAQLVANDDINGVILALCEASEAQLAHAQGDAVAVLMRMIAVVEGKQRLGGER